MVVKYFHTRIEGDDLFFFLSVSDLKNINPLLNFLESYSLFADLCIYCWSIINYYDAYNVYYFVLDIIENVRLIRGFLVHDHLNFFKQSRLLFKISSQKVNLSLAFMDPINRD